MRTTLTLDDDVAARIERLREEHGLALKEIVNEALRIDLEQIEAAPVQEKRFSMPTADLGPCLIGTIVSVSEALTIAEGESRRV